MKMTNQQRQNLIGIMVLLNLCFIWGNSLLPPHTSNAISDRVTEIIQSVFAVQKEDGEMADTWWTGRHVRKLAHATEFAALGVLTSAYAAARGKKLRDCWSIIALSGVLTALIDEAIQLFNGRTSAVKDVWIDSGGFAFGMLLIAFLLARNGKRGGFSKISDRNG